MEGATATFRGMSDDVTTSVAHHLGWGVSRTSPAPCSYLLPVVYHTYGELFLTPPTEDMYIYWSHVLIRGRPVLFGIFVMHIFAFDWIHESLLI